MRWAYAVTTVASRAQTHLPRTLASLALAGFPSPRVDVDTDGHAYARWILTLAGLLLRQPEAEAYAVFQDDVIAVKGLCQYMDGIPDGKHYFNMYCEPGNEELSGGRVGWYPSNQLGWGALGLAFRRAAARALLTSEHCWDRVHNPHRAKKHIDGAVVEAMHQRGYTEMVHYPSLLQHTGVGASVLNDGCRAPSASFPGEDFDALSLRRTKRAL